MVVVCDAGRPRNLPSSALNGFLTRDPIEPAQLLHLARKELLRYGVGFRDQEAAHAAPSCPGFTVTLADGERLQSRKLLLATGVRDILPNIDGLEPLYGRSVFHCPYCDGWERRDTCLGAYGRGNAAIGLALSLRTWSANILACTDAALPDDHHLESAERNRIRLRHERVVRLEGRDGLLHRVHFESGPPEACDALFFNTGQVQRSGLPRLLGCRFKDDGGVQTTDRQCTSVPGLYLAGDADKDVQFAIVAAAEGATAAVAINRELQDEDRGTKK